MAGLDPENNKEWLHFHLQKCYTPYMDALGCLFAITDKEVQKMKKEAGAEGWKKIESWFINDTAKTTGEKNAKMMWELATNLKQIHELTRRRDGPLFGEYHHRGDGGDGGEGDPRTIRSRPFSLAEALGVNDVNAQKKQSGESGASTNSRSKPYMEVEDMFAVAKEEEIKERMQLERQESQKKKSFWSFGS